MPRKKIINKETSEEKVEIKAEPALEPEPNIVSVVELEETAEEKKARAPFLRAVGRRKESVARIKLFKNGKGQATVNGKDIKQYFGADVLVETALGALTGVNQLKKLDLSAKVSGGGLHGQAEAIRLGTARALLQLNPVFKKNLRKAGFLTRDPRMKERKKPGLKKARRAPQWSKR